MAQGGKHYRYAYDSLGRLSSKQFADGNQLTYNYSPVGRLASLSLMNQDSLLMHREYEYNEVGNLISLDVRTAGAQQSRRYEYDGLSQLVATYDQNSLIEQFEYDAFGNRVRVRNESGEQHFLYNQANQLVSEWGYNDKANYDYDMRGNRISRQDGSGQTLYSYNWFNQLTEVQLPSQQIHRYDYNALGHRISEHKISSDGRAQSFRNVIDSLRRRERPIERQSEQTESETYLWDYSLLSDGAGRQFMEGELGNIVAHWDERGHLEALSYASFGQTESSLAFGYTGHGYSPDTELVYAENRYYDPRTAQFLSVDRVKGITSLPQSLNSYTYVWNNPMNLVDPDGNWPLPHSPIQLENKELVFEPLESRNPIEEIGNALGKINDFADSTVKYAGDTLNAAWEGVTGWLGEKVFGVDLLTEQELKFDFRSKDGTFYAKQMVSGYKEIGGRRIVAKVDLDKKFHALAFNFPEYLTIDNKKYGADTTFTADWGDGLKIVGKAQTEWASKGMVLDADFSVFGSNWIGTKLNIGRHSEDLTETLGIDFNLVGNTSVGYVAEKEGINERTGLKYVTRTTIGYRYNTALLLIGATAITATVFFPEIMSIVMQFKPAWGAAMIMGLGLTVVGDDTAKAHEGGCP